MTSIAASAPTAAASAQPRVSIRPTLTPSSRDTSGANAAARIRSPTAVRVNSSARPTTTARTAAKTNRSYGRQHGDPADRQRGPAERGRRRPELVAVDHAEHRLDDQHQAERDDHRVERRPVLDEAHHDPLHQRAEDQAGQQRGDEASQYEPVAGGDRVADVRGRHRHRALGEVDHRAARQMSTRASANAAYTAPCDSPSRVRKMNRSTSEPQVGVAEILVVAQRAGRRVGDHPAERHDHAAGRRRTARCGRSARPAARSARARRAAGAAAP